MTLNDFNRGTLSGSFGGVGLHIGVSHQDWPTGLVMLAIGLAVIVFLHRDNNTLATLNTAEQHDNLGDK